MSQLKHPGTIIYVDEERGTESSKPADEAPEHMRFRDGVPVVRVVRSAAGHSVSIQEFGPGGELLRSHVGFR